MTVSGIVVAIIIGLFAVMVFYKPATDPRTIIKNSRPWYSPDYDNTDDVDRGKSSNVTIWADPATGVQYIVTPFGGITPRIDNQGNPTQVITDTEGNTINVAIEDGEG